MLDEQFALFKKWINDKNLLNVEIVSQKKGRRNLSVRLLKLDEEMQTLLVYDVDQKQVLSLMINQIDRIQPAEIIA